MSCIVFTGGGTAGHVFPGLAIVESLPEDVEVVWLGSKNGRDASFVSTLPRVKFIAIPSGKYRRYFSFRNVVDVFKVICAFFASLFILLKLKPVLLFSKGGFVSTPPCIAAYVLHIPVITHECDSSPGLATKINAYFAKKILTSYPQTTSFLNLRHRSKVIYTGNPVRSIFFKASTGKTKDILGEVPSKPILLVLGGSLGAEQINELIYANINELLKHFVVVHQSGEGNIEKAKTVLNELKKDDDGRGASISYHPYAFIGEELPDLILSASIVVSRSGSNALWELAILGAPMVLIPLEKGSSRGDQVENALFFSEEGAAIVLRSSDLNGDVFLNTLIDLKNDEAKRKLLGENAKRLSNRDVNKKIVDIIKQEAMA